MRHTDVAALCVSVREAVEAAKHLLAGKDASLISSILEGYGLIVPMVEIDRAEYIGRALDVARREVDSAQKNVTIQIPLGRRP